MCNGQSNAPCSVSPHPALLSRTRLSEAQGRVDAATQARIKTAFPPQSGFLGLNDGAIFPKSHFAPDASIKKVAAAALERKPLRNSIRIFVVVVDFKDVKCPPGVIERHQDLWFSKGKIPTGSVTEYYSEVSNNAVSLTGDVLGPFTLKENMANYANNEEAFNAVKDKTNFNQYDNDGNGYVDAFVVVHAGRAAEGTGTRSDIWSVKWQLPEERKVNDVKVFGFLTVPADAKCGVCAHEIGHLVFGWPDLYDIDQSSAGIGNWCLMAGGTWGGGGDRPVHPSAWCKSNQKWVETITEDSNHSVTLRDVKTGFKVHRLWKDGDANSPEYFLVENRQTVGSDEFLPGRGLLIWHIDDRVGSNTDENHPWVKLMQADGLDQLKQNFARGDDGDSYPGHTDNRKFSALSNPNSKSYGGEDTFVSVTNIPISSPTMTFDITVKKVDPPPADKFDPNMWYRLKNTFEPSTHCLDVVNDNGISSKGLLTMAATGNFSGQHWQLKPNDDGTYFLRTLFLGANRQLGVQGDKKTPILETVNESVKGQYWTIGHWDHPQDGTWHLENAWTEKSQFLDTMEGGPKVSMNQANTGRPTQRWTIEAILPITEPGF